MRGMVLSARNSSTLGHPVGCPACRGSFSGFVKALAAPLGFSMSGILRKGFSCNCRDPHGLASQIAGAGKNVEAKQWKD